MLARRLGALTEEFPNGAEISVADLAAELCVGPPRIHDGLNRLHRPGLVAYSPEHGVVGTSGFAASVGEKGRSALSPYVHDRNGNAIQQSPERRFHEIRCPQPV
jgi:DNA-binding IclR family transcriptional regulator